MDSISGLSVPAHICVSPLPCHRLCSFVSHSLLAPLLCDFTYDSLSNPIKMLPYPPPIIYHPPICAQSFYPLIYYPPIHPYMYFCHQASIHPSSQSSSLSIHPPTHPITHHSSQPFSYVSTQTLIHVPPSHPSTRVLKQPFLHLSNYPPTICLPPIHPPMHLFIHPSTQPPFHSPVQLSISPLSICPSTHPPMHACIHPSTHSLNYPFIHLFNYPPTHQPSTTIHHFALHPSIGEGQRDG